MSSIGRDPMPLDPHLPPPPDFAQMGPAHPSPLKEHKRLGHFQNTPRHFLSTPFKKYFYKNFMQLDTRDFSLQSFPFSLQSPRLTLSSATHN